MYIQKKRQRVKAYLLGKDDRALENYFQNKQIQKHPDGTYEIKTTETILGKGEIAQEGDWLRVDNQGGLYPNTDEYFQSHFTCTDEPNIYETVPVPLKAWTETEPVSPEMEWLFASGKIKINSNDQNHWYQANLWGTEETTPKNSIILFYEIKTGKEGITDIDFNFVKKDIFDQTYEILNQVLE